MSLCTYIPGETYACTHAHAPLVFSFSIVREVLHRLTASWKATGGGQETARFFLLEIASFGTPKARLKNTPRPKIVAHGERRSRQFSMTTPCDGGRSLSTPAASPSSQKINPSSFVALQHLPFVGSLIRYFLNLARRDPQRKHTSHNSIHKCKNQ